MKPAVSFPGRPAFAFNIGAPSLPPPVESAASGTHTPALAQSAAQAEQLANAANIINAAPSALQLRYLQTLSDISSDQSRTIIFPLPMDLISAFIGAGGAAIGPRSVP